MTPLYRLELFKDVEGLWWWHVRARNGQIVANSAEGYKNRAWARTMARKLADAFPREQS